MKKSVCLVIASTVTLTLIMANTIYPSHAQDFDRAALTPQSQSAPCFMVSDNGSVINLDKICGKPSQIKVNYVNQYSPAAPQGVSSAAITDNPEAPTPSPLENVCKSKDDCVEQMGSEAPPPAVPPIEGAFQG